MKEHFTRFPNNHIRCDIEKEFAVSRKFYITYILIDKYRSTENYSWITIEKIFQFYGYKLGKNKPKAFGEVLDVLEYMINNKMIEVAQNLNNIKYDTGIEIKIIPEKFDAIENFTIINTHEINSIMMDESSINKENILLAYLYIKSYIGCRNADGSGHKYPEAFFRSIGAMSEALALSKHTIEQCIDSLTMCENPLLIKHIVGSVYCADADKPKNVPNIYVLNKEGYKQEIAWAINKMKEIYNVEKFYPPTC